MSDELILDLSNYKDRVGSRVPPGTYRVQVEDVERTESSNKNDMINLWFAILDGEFMGQTITDRLVITEKSLFRVVGFMQGIGLPTPKKKLKLNIRQFVGRTLDIEVDDGEPYNGRVRSEVRGYRKVAGGVEADVASDLPDTDDSATDLPDAEEPAQKAQAETPGAASEEAKVASVDAGDDLDLSAVEL